MRYIILMFICVFSLTFFIYCSSEQKAAVTVQKPLQGNIDPFIKAVAGKSWISVRSDSTCDFDASGNGVQRISPYRIAQYTYLESVDIFGCKGAFYAVDKKDVQSQLSDPTEYTILYLLNDGLLSCVNYHPTLKELKDNIGQLDKLFFAVLDNATGPEAKKFLSLLSGGWDLTTVWPARPRFLVWRSDTNTGKMLLSVDDGLSFVGLSCVSVINIGNRDIGIFCFNTNANRYYVWFSIEGKSLYSYTQGRDVEQFQYINGFLPSLDPMSTEYRNSIQIGSKHIPRTDA